MKVTFVIVPSVDEQIAEGQTSIIDPRGVRDVTTVPILPAGRMDSFPIGIASNIRVEDGRVVGDIEVGFMGSVSASDKAADGSEMIDSFDLLAMTIGPIPAKPRNPTA